MRIVTWNANSTKLRLPRVLELLGDLRPAIHENLGMRIDHILLTPELSDRLEACDIARDHRTGSKPPDHAPLVAELARD